MPISIGRLASACGVISCRSGTEWGIGKCMGGSSAGSCTGDSGAGGCRMGGMTDVVTPPTKPSLIRKVVSTQIQIVVPRDQKLWLSPTP
ncbi:hypothetical protein CLU88_2415 [Acidovorax sp. 56]|nr:hypothetical protein CLU88_2415 [Acidovorax sp. 56]